MTREEILQIAKPILFNTDMVKAILDGRKTVTRRKIDIDIINNCDMEADGTLLDYQNEYGDFINLVKLCRYQKDDYLYVRETWCNANKPNYEPDYYYFADTKICEDYDSTEWTWRPSIHMPKDAARIFLRVTDVRVERLQNIDSHGILAEGVNNEKNNPSMGKRWENIQRIAFSELWNSTIPKKDLDKYGWNANPWVWVIEFERVIPD